MKPGDPYAKRDQFADVREQLVGWLADDGEDPEIDPRIWDYLLDQPELLRDARAGNMARLFQHYAVTREHFPGRRRREKEREEVEIGPDARSDALAEMAACAALRYEWHIAGFRQSHLGDCLVPVEEIADWVEEQARREGPPAELYVLAPIADWRMAETLMVGDHHESYARWLAAEAERVAANPGAEVPERVTRAPQRLSYGVPGQRPKSIAIRGDGALAQLKRLVSGWAGDEGGLGGHVPWGEFEAVAFVLSGSVPPLPKASVGVRFSHGFYAALSRLRLEVDPRLTPKEVGQLYNRWRARFMQGRDRPMDEKHLALAVFTERTRHDGAPWSELRETWNAEQLGWAFAVDEDPFAKRFALECRTAWSRVTGEKWGHVMGMPAPAPKGPTSKRSAQTSEEASP